MFTQYINVKEAYFIYRKIQAEHERISKELEILEKKLAQLPQGKLIVTKSKGYIRFFWSDGHNKTYLKKSRREIIYKLAYKKYLQLQIQD